MASVTPKLYALKYEYVENIVEKRTPYREAHIAHFMKQVQNGNIILGGSIDQPPTAGLTIVRNLTEKEVEQIAKQDPYVINGLVTKYTIKPFLAVVGDNLLKGDLVQI
jgi:uncharacterized protein YciI